MGGQLVHAHSPEASAASARGPSAGSERPHYGIRCPGQNATAARCTRGTSSCLCLRPCCSPGAAQPVPYLVQGKGPDGVGRQLDCVQQRDLDHPIGFRTPARPVLVTLHLQGGEEKGSVLGWGLWGGKRMDVEKNHRATGPKHPSSPPPDLHSSCCKPAWQTAPIHPQGPSPPAPSSPCDSLPAHLLMPSSSSTIHSSAFATDSFSFLLSSPELPHLIWHPELPISSGTWLPPRGAAAPG